MAAAAVFDVAVLGAGPAGCSAAIMLASAGHRVGLLAPASPPRPLARCGAVRIGDSLAPEAAPVLRRLGVWTAFKADGHLPCHSNRSVWGSDRPHQLDFIHHPQGHGYHIDRECFDRRLLERAVELGAALVPLTAPLAVVRAGERWQLMAGAVNIDAARVVDASGRAAWFARRQGAQRCDHGPQVALVAWLQGHGGRADDGASLIEAVADGWWYSAPLPGGRWSTAFFTDADLHDHRALRTEHGWRAALAAAPLTSERLAVDSPRWRGRPSFVPADSGRLDHPCGAGWVAVGDAAISYDPLSAHGLTVALASGVDAGDALHRELAGDLAATDGYARRLRGAFEAYAAMRLRLYCSETRFTDQPYWARRQAPSRAPPAMAVQ